MEISDIEAVLEFLRKNGLSHSESALMDDILEKSQLGSFDFQKFLFPISPPPLPPLKIPPPPPPRRQPELVDLHAPPPDDHDDNSSDEFVSMASSTTELCSSDFTNPYGIRNAKGASSQASSDRMSQFGTARDYHDFDMQNDLNWYRERDDDYNMPPFFDNPDPFSAPSEDKFVMTSEEDGKKNDTNQLVLDPLLDPLEATNYLDKQWSFTSIGYSKDGVKVTDYYYHLDGNCPDQNIQDANLYSSFKEIDLNDYDDISIGHKSSHSLSCVEDNRGCNYDKLVGDSKSTQDVQTQAVKKESYFDENGHHDGSCDREIQEFHGNDTAEVEEGEDTSTSDELLKYANEEEYEVFDLRIIHRKNRTGFEEQKDLPIVQNSVIGSRYCVTEYLGSAAFSKVVQAHDLQMGIDVCLKIIKNDKDFFDQSLDEIKLLKYVNKYDPGDEHHILRLYDYFYFQEHLIIVCELLRANLYEFQKYNRETGGEPYFTLNRLQVITRQCLEALDYLHSLGVIHCDLKPENILIKSYSRCEIKVIDLGSSCFQNDNLSLYVQSRSYRAPEVIIGLPYDQKIDIWSLGCILAELFSGDVLFPNDELVVLLARVIGMLGPIDTEMLEKGQETDKYFTKEFDLYHVDEENQMEYVIPMEQSLEEHLQVSDTLFIDFVRNLLEINPERRPTAREALQHPWLSYPYETS